MKRLIDERSKANASKLSEEENMRIKAVVSNTLFVAFSLILVLSLIAILNAQTKPDTQSASAPQLQPTLQILTPPPRPTFNPTEIAEENMPAVAPVVTPVSPEIESDSIVSNLRPLVAEEPAIFMAWSPDSSLALVQKKSRDYTFMQFKDGTGIHGTIGDLWVIDATGKVLTKVSDAAQAWAWSPDSQSVLFAEPVDLNGGLEGKLLAVDVGSQEIRSVANIKLVPGSNIQWLPTNRIFLSQGSSLYRVDLEGNKDLLPVAGSLKFVPFSADTMGASSFRLCSSESRVAYTIPRDNGNELWVANPDGSNSIKVADWVSYFEWKPDCTELVFSSIHKYQGAGYDSSIMVANQDGKNLREIVPVAQVDEVNDIPRWVKSGDKIIYSKRVPVFDPNGRLEFQIWIVDSKGEKTSLLVKHAGPFPELSTDGRLLAFNAQTASRLDWTSDTANAFVAEVNLGK